MSAVDDGTAMTGPIVAFALAVTACNRPPRLLLVTVNQNRLVVAVATVRRPIVAVAPDRQVAGTVVHRYQARLVTVTRDRIVVAGAATYRLLTAVTRYRRVVHRGRRDRSVLVAMLSRIGGGAHLERSRRHRLRNATTLPLRSVSVLYGHVKDAARPTTGLRQPHRRRRRWNRMCPVTTWSPTRMAVAGPTSLYWTWTLTWRIWRCRQPPP